MCTHRKDKRGSGWSNITLLVLVVFVEHSLVAAPFLVEDMVVHAIAKVGASQSAHLPELAADYSRDGDTCAVVIQINGCLQRVRRTGGVREVVEFVGG